MAPTDAQLRAEPAWRAEVVTDELWSLIDGLCAHFGVTRAATGAKGDRFHLSGGHRSQRWILASVYCTNRTYTVEPGLSPSLVDCLSAFDITLPREHMLTISRNADRATRAGELEELVEWYGTVDGERVVGWNNVKNRVESSDSSHLWHFHGRIRRALLRDMTTMRRILAALTGGDMTPEESTALKRIDDRITTLVYNAPVNAWNTGGQKGERNQLREQLDRLEGACAALGAGLKAVAERVDLAAIEEAARRGAASAAVDVQALAAALADALDVDQAVVVAALESPAGQAALVAAANTAEDS